MRILPILITATLAAVEATGACAAYKITAGDVLGLSVVGAPDLSIRVPVDLDGQATLPIVGQVAVAGLDLAGARARVQSALSGKSYRRRTEDGREFPVIISPAEVGLSVAEYRPIYINGDIATPGEQVYRPGLTIREAVARAGGFNLMRYKLENPFLQIPDMTSTYNSLLIKYAGQVAVIARLSAELDGKTALDATQLQDTPIASHLKDEILDGQKALVLTRAAERAKEITYLKAAITKETERSQVLSEQKEKEEAGVRADTADLQRLEGLFNKGAVALPGLSDARRTVLLSSTRALETTSLLNSVQREAADLGRRLERVDDDRRVQVLTDLDAARSQLAVLRSELRAAGEKLRYTGMLRSQMVGGTVNQSAFTVVRMVEGKRMSTVSTIDTDLQPGDVVEVAMQVDLLPPER